MRDEHKRLVILTTHFGTQFSGGSRATVEIFSRLEDRFREVVVVGTELGDHPFSRFRFIKYGNWWQAIRILRKFDPESTIFYGDFYNAFLLILARRQFYFTYHDNWPELAAMNLKTRMEGVFYIPAYKWIFRHARHVFSVSDARMPFIKRSTRNVSVVRNGVTRHTTSTMEKKDKLLMVGTIDDRKYDLAIKLFREMQVSGDDISTDIYGPVRNSALARHLSRFPSVTIKTYADNIPYSSYKALLHTSYMENLSMVFCEALSWGVPVIAFDVGGAGEVLNENNAYLIEPYDIHSMQEACRTVIVDPSPFSFDPKAMDAFNWELTASRYIEHME